MRKLIFVIVALSAVAVVGADARSAAADGFSIRFGGSPAYGYRTARYGYDAYYGRPYGSYYGYRSHYYPHGGHSWHDTSHWDYHPGGFVRHYDHYDYVPPHWHFHEEGHWDHHHW